MPIMDESVVAQPGQVIEDLEGTCARTRVTHMALKTINCNKESSQFESASPKDSSPKVEERISDISVKINGTDSSNKELTKQPHSNIFRPAAPKRSPLSDVADKREAPILCPACTSEKANSSNKSDQQAKSMSTVHTGGVAEAVMQSGNDHQKHPNRACDTGSKGQQVTSAAGKDDIISLDGFVNRACDTSASNGSDDINCAKLPDFNICFSRTPSGRSGRSQKSSAAMIKPVPAKQTQAAEQDNDKPPFKFAGIVVSMLGSLCFCTSALCIKLFPENSPYGLQEKLRAVFVRGIILMSCCGASLYMQGASVRVPSDEIWVNAARALLGCCGTIGGYLALCYISLGDGAALVFSSPVWTSLLSHFILGEPLSWILLVALPCSLVGIILIAHPALIVDLFITPDLAETPMFAELNSTVFNDSALELSFGDIDDVVPSELAADGTENNRWIGVCIALATSLCVSGVYIILKFRRTTKIQTTTFWLGFVTCIEGFIALCIVGFGDVPSLEEAGLLFVNGFFSWIGQTCMQWGLYYENASILSVVRTSEVAMSFTMSALLLDDEIYWTSILGAAIIACVVVLMILNNWLSNRADKGEKESDGAVDIDVKTNVIKANNDAMIRTGKKKRCSSNT